jgi:hypothetical protein
VFSAIQTHFTWVIKQTLRLLAGTISVLFAGNSAGSPVNRPVLVLGWPVGGTPAIYLLSII